MIISNVFDFLELCISEKSSEERLQRALQLLLLLLPEENWLMLKDIIILLHLTASREGQNKMSAENLATLFTPHLLCPRKVRCFHWKYTSSSIFSDLYYYNSIFDYVLLLLLISENFVFMQSKKVFVNFSCA